MREAAAYFDLKLHADGLTDQDLRSMECFGVRGALLPAHDGAGADAKGLLAHFDRLVRVESVRLSRLGIRAPVALGVHPSVIPWHGLDEVLAAIPRLAGSGRVAAIGEIGLDLGGAREEQALERQLELARTLRLPAIVHTPERGKERVTRRVLALIRDSGISPSSVLLDHADRSTLKAIRECGMWAGLTVNPSHLSAESAVGLVGEFGSEGLLISSGAGDGACDILSLARTASKLSEAKLSRPIARRVLCENALAFLGLPRDALEGGGEARLRRTGG